MSYIYVPIMETFETIDEVFKKVFSSKRPQPRPAYFKPLPSFAGTEIASCHIWFPKFETTKKGNFLPATDIALNQLSADGEEIVEILPKATICKKGDKKITFAKFDDFKYKFIGIFEVVDIKEKGKISFNRKIGDKCLKI